MHKLVLSALSRMVTHPRFPPRGRRCQPPRPPSRRDRPLTPPPHARRFGRRGDTAAVPRETEATEAAACDGAGEGGGEDPGACARGGDAPRGGGGADAGRLLGRARRARLVHGTAYSAARR